MNLKLLQFKITLEDVKPPIWRKIQILDDCTFWDLHVAIQDAMGWKDCHLHNFSVINPNTGAKEQLGIPAEDGTDQVLADWLFKVHTYVINPENKSMQYLYDFGDCWKHRIEFEGVYFSQNGVKYPRCLAGDRACPPEDVGGISGYEHYLEVLENPMHSEYTELLAWNGNFYSENFNPRWVKFS